MAGSIDYSLGVEAVKLSRVPTEDNLAKRGYYLVYSNKDGSLHVINDSGQISSQIGVSSIATAPGSSAANVIQPSGDYIPLTIEGSAAQTANLQVWENSTPTILVSISAAGVVTLIPLDAGTNAVLNSLIVDHSSSGTPAANYGTAVQLQGKSSTTLSRAMTRLRTLWTTATDASRKARGVLSAFDTAERDCIAWEASGAAAMVGFLGAAPVIQQTTYTQTYSTAASTVNPASTSAFTGIDNLQAAGTPYAQVADLNTLRGDLLMAMQLINHLIDDLQAYGLAA